MSKFPSYDAGEHGNAPSFGNNFGQKVAERVEDDLSFAEERIIDIFVGDLCGGFQGDAAEEALLGNTGTHFRVGGHRAGRGQRDRYTCAFQLFAQTFREGMDVCFGCRIDGLVGGGCESCHTADVQDMGMCVLL